MSEVFLPAFLSRRSTPCRQRILSALGAFSFLAFFVATTSSVHAQSVHSPAGESVSGGQRPIEPASDGFPAFEAPGPSEAGPGENGFPFASPLVTTVSSLLVVLAIFGGVVWVARRYGHASVPPGALPNDIVQNLGSTQLDASTKVSLLKCGERILVVGQAAGGGLQTLTEITDADEVSRLTNRCLGRPEIVGRRSLIDHDRSAEPVTR